jgi:hypothetical protein
VEINVNIIEKNWWKKNGRKKGRGNIKKRKKLINSNNPYLAGKKKIIKFSISIYRN